MCFVSILRLHFNIKLQFCPLVKDKHSYEQDLSFVKLRFHPSTPIYNLALENYDYRAVLLDHNVIEQPP